MVRPRVSTRRDAGRPHRGISCRHFERERGDRENCRGRRHASARRCWPSAFAYPSYDNGAGVGCVSRHNGFQGGNGPLRFQHRTRFGVTTCNLCHPNGSGTTPVNTYWSGFGRRLRVPAATARITVKRRRTAVSRRRPHTGCACSMALPVPLSPAAAPRAATSRGRRDIRIPSRRFSARTCRRRTTTRCSAT